jgi:hypothetical protein
VASLRSKRIYQCGDCGHRYFRAKHSKDEQDGKGRKNKYLVMAVLVLSAILGVAIVEWLNQPIEQPQQSIDR